MFNKANHARQQTDTSTFNMFLNDEAFQKIVLGGNYFRINRLTNAFNPPPVCGDSVSRKSSCFHFEVTYLGRYYTPLKKASFYKG